MPLRSLTRVALTITSSALNTERLRGIVVFWEKFCVGIRTVSKPTKDISRFSTLAETFVSVNRPLALVVVPW